MRIVDDTATRIVLRDRTAWISYLCWGCALFLGGSSLVEMDGKRMALAAICAAFGIPFFRTSYIVFDTAQRSCTVQRRDMWRRTRVVIPFDKIKDVLVETMIGDYNSQLTSCRLSLSTVDGEVALSSSYEPDLDRFNNMRNMLVTAISGRQPAAAAADPVRALVNAGHNVEAVSLLRRRDRLSIKEAMERVGALENDAPAT